VKTREEVMAEVTGEEGETKEEDEDSDQDLMDLD